MLYTIPNFIQGKECADQSVEKQPIYNPAIGEVIGQVAFASEEEVEAAIDAAKNAFLTWSQTPPLKRARIIFRFKSLLEKNIDKIAAIVTQEHGKIFEDAKGSVFRGIELVEYACGTPSLLKGSYSENVSTNIDSYTIFQPLGVCAGISPFNFPVMVPIWMFIPAIACGNTFILKPSEKDPSAPFMLAQLIQEAGLPDGVLNILNGDKKVVDQLISHSDIQAVSCVGSTPVAKYIYQTATQKGKRAHTFGGAKNHCVVMPDADLNEAATAIANAAYGSAGERCMALSAVIAVGDTVADQLIDKIKQEIATIQVGPGDDPTSQMGPLITKTHWQRVNDYIDLGVNEGARLIVDGRNIKVANHKNGFFMGASLFDQVSPTMRIYLEEIFGPVLVIVRVADFEKALSLVNNHEYGNGTAIFTRDGEVARQFASHVQVGMVGVNVPIPVPVAYHTFGGWKHSHFGDMGMHGLESVRFYTKQKTVTSRWPKSKLIERTYHMPHH